MRLISGIRKNIGTIIASIGFLLLCILTFGDLAEITTEQYWKNVLNNLTSIGYMSVALTMIQVSIKQGVAEQALQRGLNTENTTKVWEEHKQIIARNNSRIIYMPYFLQIYNERQTILKKREFLVNNNFTSEKALLMSGRKNLINKYNNIRIYITVSRIKWATTDIIYNKHGQIMNLTEYRKIRTVKGIVLGLFFMAGVTLLSTGLFVSTDPAPLWQKFIKLGTYILVMLISSVYGIVKNYEKGAFGVPNELTELNNIWLEFELWKTPDWILKEVEELNQPKEVLNEKTKTSDDSGTNIQTKFKESEIISTINPDSIICLPGPCASDVYSDSIEKSK